MNSRYAWRALVALGFGATPATVAAQVASIRLDASVGLAQTYCTMPDPNNCTAPPASAANVAVGPGEDFVTAYTVTNLGSASLTRHDLSDSVAGALLTDFPYTLASGASAYLARRTSAPMVPGVFGRSATWTARNPPLLTAVDGDAYSVTVLQPSISMRATVAPAASVCSNVNDLATCSVPLRTTLAYVAGRKLVVGYEVTNTGDVVQRRHDLVDPGIGPILTDFPFTLLADASAFILEFDTPAAEVVRDVTWTSRTVSGYSSVASARYVVSGNVFRDGFE